MGMRVRPVHGLVGVQRRGLNLGAACFEKRSIRGPHSAHGHGVGDSVPWLHAIDGGVEPLRTDREPGDGAVKIEWKYGDFDP